MSRSAGGSCAGGKGDGEEKCTTQEEEAHHDKLVNEDVKKFQKPGLLFQKPGSDFPHFTRYWGVAVAKTWTEI